ncbi:hypothetical protein HK405_001873, partial [Cladochytrium tenue]
SRQSCVWRQGYDRPSCVGSRHQCCRPGNPRRPLDQEWLRRPRTYDQGQLGGSEGDSPQQHRSGGSSGLLRRAQLPGGWVRRFLGT